MYNIWLLEKAHQIKLSVLTHRTFTFNPFQEFLIMSLNLENHKQINIHLEGKEFHTLAAICI